jgi:class 3 adenylate cyclase
LICPSCQRENPADARFCTHCAAALACSCASCGAELPPGARFCSQCAHPVEPPKAQPSTTHPASFVSGRYQVQQFLGEGAKKRVYLARDSRLDRDVAFALIKTEGLDEAGRTRARREAQAMGRLGDHPHIVTVHDIGEEDGELYIVSQHMPGGDLGARLQAAENRRLPIDEALRIADELCAALEHAHARGVIHRDLKPENIYLAEDGTAKLGDFGLALSPDRTRLTQEGMMVGTVAYMPPEQALGKVPDARSDLYALGATLYEMVTGRPPFLSDDPVSILSQHVNTPPVAPSWHNPEVPSPLEALIESLLAKTPEERPGSAGAVRGLLQSVVRAPHEPVDSVVAPEPTRPGRLLARTFAGRASEMKQLRTAMDQAVSSRGGVFMLAGEPGIGKTRTAEELISYARLRDVQALVGHCYEGEGAPAYWPWLQIIRSYVHDRDPVELLSEIGSGAQDIAQVVSEVRERLPGLPAPAALEPERARFRLFDSITTFLKNASRKQPLLIVLDGLHWADKPSLLLLHFLAREIRDTRILILGTYRQDEIQREHPLAEVLSSLRRERSYQRIVLRGLQEKDTRAMISDIGGQDAPQAFARAIFLETEGNPFFIEEILRYLVEEGILHPEGGRWTSDLTPDQMGIPEGVREVIGRRLSRLGERCNATLTLASVIGREFSLNALERLSGLCQDELLEILDEAVRAQVIDEFPATLGRFTFSHALIRETLYDELSAHRRVTLHRQVGLALEELHASKLEPHLDELAHHFFEAARGGDVEKAIHYAWLAGKRAEGLLAYEEAATNYERALQLLELSEDADEAQRCDLLLALGEAHNAAGNREKAKESFRGAADLGRSLGAPEPLARAALGFGATLESGFTVDFGVFDEDLVALLKEALAALGEQDSVLRIRVLARLATALYWSEADDWRAELMDEAVKAARRMGDTAALATALNVEERLAVSTEVVRLAEEAGDVELALSGHAARLIDLLDIGDVREAEKERQAYARLAEQYRQPVFLLRYIPTHAAMKAILEGRFEEAEELAHQALALGQTARDNSSIQAFGAQMFLLRREQGRLGELEAAIRQLVDDFPTVPTWRAVLAWLYHETGRPADARREVEHAAAKDFEDFPRDLNWMIGLMILSEVCSCLGDAPRAEKLYELVLPYGHRYVTIGPAVGYFGSVSRSLGLLATTMGRREEAAQHFEDALDRNARIGARCWLARTQHEYARMLLVRGKPGDREKAAQLVNRALGTAQDTGMKALVDRALALKLELQGIDSGSIQGSIHVVNSAVQARRPDLSSQTAPDGTVTLMFSDMEAFTAMTERLGDLKAHEVIRTHNAIVREQRAAHGGYEVELLGDGFLLAFGSARTGLLCAIAVQRAFTAYNERYPEEPILVRIGLHTGEVVKDADTFYGKAVNLAARIAAQAKGGEILVSYLLKELTESAGDLRFGEAREVELKGISEKQRVHPVEWA